MFNNDTKKNVLLHLPDTHYVEIFKYLKSEHILNFLIALAKHPNDTRINFIKNLIRHSTFFLHPEFNLIEYFRQPMHIASIPFINLSQSQQLKIAKAAVENPLEFCIYLKSTHSLKDKELLIEYISFILHQAEINNESFIRTIFFHTNINLKIFPKLSKDIARFMNDEHPELRWNDLNILDNISKDEKLHRFIDLILEAGSYTKRLNLLNSFINTDVDFAIKQEVFLKLLNYYSFSMSRLIVDSFFLATNQLSSYQKEMLMMMSLQKPILNPILVNAFKHIHFSIHPNAINPLFDHCSNILNHMNYREDLDFFNIYNPTFFLDWPHEENVENYLSKQSIEPNELLKLIIFYRLTVFLESGNEEKYVQSPQLDIELITLGHQLFHSEVPEHQMIFHKLTSIIYGLSEDRLLECGHILQAGLIYQKWHPEKINDLLFKASRLISAVDSTHDLSVKIIKIMLNTSPSLAQPYCKLHIDYLQQIIFTTPFKHTFEDSVEAINPYFGIAITWETQILAIDCLVRIQPIDAKLLIAIIKFTPYLFPCTHINTHMRRNIQMAFADMLNIDIEIFSSIPDKNKGMYLIKNILNNPNFQLEDSIATIKCYLPILQNSHINFEFKLLMIPYLFDKAPASHERTKEIYTILIENAVSQLVNPQMIPSKIHALYQHPLVNLKITLAILDVFQQIEIRYLVQLGHIFQLSACLTPNIPNFKDILLKQLFIKVGVKELKTIIALECAKKLIQSTQDASQLMSKGLISLLNCSISLNDKIKIGTFLINHSISVNHVLSYFQNTNFDDSDESITFKELLSQQENIINATKRQKL